MTGASARVLQPVSRPRYGSTNLAGGAWGGGYEGAMRSRRLFGFRATEQSINSLLAFSGATLRARARWLSRNNPYAKKAKTEFVSNLVCTGIKPISKIDPDESPGVKESVHRAWEDWTDECDADGLTDFYGLQDLIGGALFDAGECFIRYRDRRAADGLSVPLQLQLLESEFCPLELNFTTGSGNLVKMGIEFDAVGRRVAYWMWRTHPGDIAIPVNQVGYTRIPAEEIVHVFEPTRPGQIRGESWLVAAMVKSYLLDQYDDAELARKQTAAYFAAFITKAGNDDQSPIGAQEQPALGSTDTSFNAPGEVNAGITPGTLQVLEPGEDIKFSAPADVGPNFEAFEYRALLAMCAGMGLPYFAVTGDLKQANYGSLRAGMLGMRRSIERIQHKVMVYQLCRNVWARWLPTAVLAKAVSITAAQFNASPIDWLRAKWTPPRWDWIDPSKDVKAEVEAIRGGLTTRSMSAAARGIDVEELDADMAADNARADALGLVLDSDPRRTNLRGSAPPPDTTPPASPDEETVDTAEEEAA